MGWITIICADCGKDSRLIRTLTQIRLGVWVCECCAPKHPPFIPGRKKATHLASRK